jgi:hypothetical protein
MTEPEISVEAGYECGSGEVSRGEVISGSIPRRDFDTYDEKSEQQCALGIFRPVVLNSVVETEAYIAFHPRIIADFATVEEIGRNILAELDV